METQEKLAAKQADEQMKNAENSKDSTSQTDKNQETAAAHAIDKEKKKATLYHDTQRVSRRANEVSDRRDTNSGGMGAGGGNSASQY